MKTYSVKASDIERQWWVIDASGQTLGRLATGIAHLLKGKHKPHYSTHIDVGDHVIVINADKIRVTGKKAAQKVYYHHSQYPGGLKSITLGKLMDKQPPKVIEHAVRGMLPHTKLGNAMFKKLKVYAGPDHPHQAQTKAMAEKEN
ncbi:50S ribosomal protein L13 [Chloroflexota bacterium]